MTAFLRARRSAVYETAILLVVAIVLAIVLQALVVKPYRIPSGSMEPTLRIGDRVLVNRFSHRVLGNDPKVGDILVFHPPRGVDSRVPVCGRLGQGGGTPTPCGQPTAGKSSQTFIKRVVAAGGDRIAIKGGHVIRNGRQVDEPFIAPCDPASGFCDFPREITVPKGYVFMMGDNRGHSADSRFWGPIRVGWVVGRAFAYFWPPKHIGGV